MICKSLKQVKPNNVGTRHLGTD